LGQGKTGGLEIVNEVVFGNFGKKEKINYEKYEKTPNKCTEATAIHKSMIYSHWLQNEPIDKD
jgi:hypothetical protein